MIIEYEQPLYRPPSEANNLILQVTVGCKFNQCSFCSMYKNKTYRVKSLDEIQDDIDQLKTSLPDTSRVFLADGDAFNLNSEFLLQILTKLQTAFPKLTRISCYATPANINSKSINELQLLKNNKLSLLYVGLETGSNILLKKITKGATQKSIAQALKLADSASVKISATIILGLGGKQYWQEHMKETIKLLNDAPVTYLSTLQLYLEDSSKKEFMDKFVEKFEPQSDSGVLLELSELIKNISPPKRVIFRSNHASNALPLAGNLPKDQHRLIREIQQTLQAPSRLTDIYQRSL